MLMYCYFLLLVTCSLLTSPNNGTISCSLGGYHIPIPGDICTFTCNTGYQLMGSAIRTCQSDLSWSGNDAICISEYVISYIATYIKHNNLTI